MSRAARVILSRVSGDQEYSAKPGFLVGGWAARLKYLEWAWVMYIAEKTVTSTPSAIGECSASSPLFSFRGNEAEPEESEVGRSSEEEEDSGIEEEALGV